MKNIRFSLPVLIACLFIFTVCKKDELLVTYDANGSVER